jgi:IPT/TIG domain-containing protein/FG-GAP repeat protein
MLRTMTARALPRAASLGRRATLVVALLVPACATLLLSVDAHGARSPLSIDSLVREQAEAKLTAGDEEGEARLGYSVAVSADGNTALVGGPLDGTYGAVWVFVREGGQWHQQGGKLQGGEHSGGVESCGREAGEEGEECNFGRSLALSADGNTAIVGNPRESRVEPPSEPGGLSTLRRNVGAAWVYTRVGSTWRMAARLTGGEETGEGRFGKSVALSGDGQTALVGGPSDRGGQGSAWTFARAGEAWSQQGPKLTAGDEQGEGFFGHSVALSGDGHTAIVGGPGDAAYAGAAWIFSFAEGVWFQHGAKLTGGGESGAGRFGYSVALSGDGATALVGARADGEGAGAAWAFAHAGGGWTQQGAKLTGGEGAAGFGYSVALSQDGATALVGAPRESSSRGSAFQYERAGEAWSAAKQLEAGVSAVGHHSWFGASVALSADGATRLVGGPNDDGQVGAAWVFGPAPAVAAVAPSQGPRAGGTEVTISGSNFTGATAVRFGAADAVSFTVVSPQTIVAVTPPGEGLVDVTVASQYGTSLPGVKFKYVAGQGGGSGPGGGAPPGGPPGSATIAVGTGGVLAFTASASAGACHVALVSRNVLVVAHSRVAFRLRVTGTGRCAGKLRLGVIRRLAAKRLQLKTIGTARFAIAAGHSALVKVKLNRAGVNMLRRHRWRLSASLLLVRQSPKPVLAQKARVRLGQAKKRARRA